MAKTFTQARFHQAIHVPGLGELGNTLPCSSKAAKTLLMSETETGLDVTFIAEKGGKARFLVPWANVIYAVESPENVTQALVSPKNTK